MNVSSKSSPFSAQKSYGLRDLLGLLVLVFMHQRLMDNDHYLFLPWDVVVYGVVNVAYRRGVWLSFSLALFAGYLVEMHSMAPKGLYMCAYGFVALLVQVFKKDLVWREGVVKMAVYAGSHGLVSFIVMIAWLRLTGGDVFVAIGHIWLAWLIQSSCLLMLMMFKIRFSHVLSSRVKKKKRLNSFNKYSYF